MTTVPVDTLAELAMEDEDPASADHGDGGRGVIAPAAAAPSATRFTLGGPKTGKLVALLWLAGPNLNPIH